MNFSPLTLFALSSTRELGERIAGRLDRELGDLEERDFDDGEHKSRPLINVRNQDVFVIQSLYSDDAQSVNDKLVRLLIFLGAVRDASAGTVTAVVPYLAYARKDQKSQPRDPVTTRYIAQLFEAVGIDRLITLDVHNLVAFQNAFRVRTDHLEARILFIRHFVGSIGSDALAVISPDVGGIKRATRFRDALASATGLEISLGFMEKARALGTMTPGRLTGDVEGRTVIIVDDMISTGGTLVHAASLCKARGAVRVCAAATHGVFVGNANAVLASADLDEIVITDSVRPDRITDDLVRRKLVVLSTAKLLAEAILRVHDGRSLVELLSGEAQV